MRYYIQWFDFKNHSRRATCDSYASRVSQCGKCKFVRKLMLTGVNLLIQTIKPENWLV